MKKIDLNPEKLGFGVYFTNHMYLSKYSPDKGWHDDSIIDYSPLQIDPAASVFHYSQEIFEGLKAYLSPDKTIISFRPEMNLQRMNKSAQRLCMPEFPEDTFVGAIRDLVLCDKDWIPDAPGTALYIRPAMIGIEPFLGVRPSNEYLFYIILSPVGPYFPEGFKPVSIYVEDKLVRAVVGGTGDIKTGGNYAASLLGQYKAKEKGFSQVLWLDAKEHKYIEEVGAMNVFFVYGNTLTTPPLTGSILPGITRASIIELARNLGYQVEERPLTIDEVVKDIFLGKITEMFGSGTAAVLSPVRVLSYEDRNYTINDGIVGTVTKTIYNHLVNIQYGREHDRYEWNYLIGKL